MAGKILGLGLTIKYYYDLGELFRRVYVAHYIDIDKSSN